MRKDWAPKQHAPGILARALCGRKTGVVAVSPDKVTCQNCIMVATTGEKPVTQRLEEIFKEHVQTKLDRVH